MNRRSYGEWTDPTVLAHCRRCGEWLRARPDNDEPCPHCGGPLVTLPRFPYDDETGP